jgi:hypothetical protein
LNLRFILFLLAVILIDDIIALRKPVSIAAAPPMMTAAVLPSSAEASQHLTISVVHELGTRPSDNVSASEDKMPEGLPTLVAKSEGEVLNQILNSALLKQTNQLLTRAESAEAKLAEKQERSAKLRTCHLAVLAVLEKQINSLKEENTKISTSLKGKESLFLSHDMLILMMLMQSCVFQSMLKLKPYSRNS